MQFGGQNSQENASNFGRFKSIPKIQITAFQHRHVTGSDSCYGLGLMLRAPDSCYGLRLMLLAQFFFPPEILKPTKQKPRGKLSQHGVTELARWHKTAYVLHFLSCYALRAMLLAQFFGGTVFVFRGGSNLELARWVWVSTMNLSEHGESEWARWVWVSTGESEWARWVWASNMGSPNLKFHQIWGLQWGTGPKSLRIRNAFKVSTCLSYSKSLDHPFSLIPLKENFNMLKTWAGNQIMLKIWASKEIWDRWKMR